MHVNQAQTLVHETMKINEVQDFRIVGLGKCRQGGQQCENDLATLNVAASQFADDERMAHDVLAMEQFHKVRFTFAQVIDPDRGVHKHHVTRPRGRGVGRRDDGGEWV